MYNESLRLGIGRFLGSLLPSFQAAIQRAAAAPRMMIFGGHDSSIIPVLSALGMDSAMGGRWPPFGSYIVMELLEDSAARGSERHVRVLYNGQEVQTIPFAEFERRVQLVTVKDYETQCKPRGHSPVPPQVW